MGKQPEKPSDQDQLDHEEALRRMDQALRGAKVAGPKPLRDKPKRRSPKK